MEGSDVTRTILGSKDDIIGHLAEHRAWARGLATNEGGASGHTALTLRERARYRGMVEGLEYAISALEDWDLEQSIHDANEALTGEALDYA